MKLFWVLFAEKKGVAMRMDGEPWWQDLPDKEGEDLKVIP